MVKENIKVIYMLSLTAGAILGGAIIDKPHNVLIFLVGAWFVFLIDKFIWSKQW